MDPKAKLIIDNRVGNPENRSVISRYIEYRLMAAGNTGSTQVKIAVHLGIFERLMDKSLRELDTETIICTLNLRRSQVKAATYAGEVKTLKMFLRWLKKFESAPFDVDVLSDIHNPQPPMTVRAQDLLTQEEISRMNRAAGNPRDRLIIVLL